MTGQEKVTFKYWWLLNRGDYMDRSDCTVVYNLIFKCWLRLSTLFNGTNTTNMTTVSWRINILCIMFKIIPFFMITLFSQFYVKVGIILTHGKHFHECVISLRGEVWAYWTSLTPSLFIVKFLLPRSESSCICVRDILHLSTIIRLEFGTILNDVTVSALSKSKIFSLSNRQWKTYSFLKRIM